MTGLPIQKIVDLAIAIQQIPAPTFSERERANFICAQMQVENLFDVWMDDLGNVYGRLPGTGHQKPVVLSAHSDTVFPPGTDLSISRGTERVAGPGIGDNALGVAGMFGLVWELRARGIDLPGDLILVANVGEEGLGDLRGMRAVVDRFGDQVLAYLVLEGMALGHIFNRGTNVLRYRISIRTPGGHSWVDHGSPSAVHELAALVTELTKLPLEEQPRTTLNVGVFGGGTTVNSIAAEGAIEVDLRSERSGELLELADQVKRVARSFQRPGSAVRVEHIGERPDGEIPADHPLVELARRCLRAQGLEPQLSIGSTDASQPLSRGFPAICIGLTTGGGAHTLDEYIQLGPLAKGMEQLVTLIPRVYELG